MEELVLILFAIFMISLVIDDFKKKPKTQREKNEEAKKYNSFMKKRAPDLRIIGFSEMEIRETALGYCKSD